MKSQADGGAIYTLSTNPGGVVSGNYIHGVPSPAYGAIYHDEGSRYWQNTGNALCDVAYQWLLLNHGMDITATRQLHHPARVHHPGQQHGQHHQRQHHRRLLRPAARPPIVEQRRPPAELPAPRPGPGRHRPPGAHRARHPDRGHRLPDGGGPQLAGVHRRHRASRATPSTATASSISATGKTSVRLSGLTAGQDVHLPDHRP